MRPDHPASVELLRMADAHLRSLQPAMKAHFHCWGWPYRVLFEYPGRVLVFDGATGALLARSQPGRPTRPAKVQGTPHVGNR